MAKIKSIQAREILDSRGNPTVETKIILNDNSTVTASVPSGASLGKYEAVELRDGDLAHYGGMGVLKAVANVNEVIAPKLVGLDPSRQKEIDQLMIKLDGTENKSKLGANAILSVSLGVCKAGAIVTRLPIYHYVAGLFGLKINKLKMPVPIFNLINGGKHGAGNLNFQEFHVIPTAQASYAVALETGEEIYQAVKKVLILHKAIHSVGDEGGFAPNLFTNLNALEILLEGIKEAGFELRRNVFLGLDVAASQFYQGGKYKIRDRTLPMDTTELVEYYQDLNQQYPLFLLEDPFHEDDWDGWKRISIELSGTMIVGDDLLATNKSRVEKAIQEKACSAVLVKPNQAGTISETMEVIKVARQAGWKIIVSHRSGETNDSFIADFAVGVGADHVKFGAPARGERVAKYNRLLTIEEELSMIKQKTRG
jgi:enolase